MPGGIEIVNGEFYLSLAKVALFPTMAVILVGVVLSLALPGISPKEGIERGILSGVLGFFLFIVSHFLQVNSGVMLWKFLPQSLGFVTTLIIGFVVVPYGAISALLCYVLIRKSKGMASAGEEKR